MILKAIGKCIDTLPIRDLLSQEEAMADAVTFEIDRFHNDEDLAEFAFWMRGVTESGGESESPLTMEILETVIRLQWLVDGNFTVEAGTLSLDLYGCRYAENAVPAEDPPECIIRFQLPAIHVRGLPESDSILERHSYTDFLLEVKATVNDGIAMIEAETAAFEEKIPDYDAQMAEMQTKLTAMEHRLEDLENRMDAMMPITVMTAEEFNALDAPDDGTLYVVTE